MEHLQKKPRVTSATSRNKSNDSDSDSDTDTDTNTKAKLIQSEMEIGPISDAAAASLTPSGEIHFQLNSNCVEHLCQNYSRFLILK